MSDFRAPTPCSLCERCAHWRERFGRGRCRSDGAAASRLADECTDFREERPGPVPGSLASLLYGNSDTRFTHT